jgi:hypothetical protein
MLVFPGAGRATGSTESVEQADIAIAKTASVRIKGLCFIMAFS